MGTASKDQALKFLEELEHVLDRNLLSPEDMEDRIRNTVVRAKTDDKQQHLRIPEAAFLNEHAIPALSKLLSHHGMSAEDARRSLLSESHRGTPHLAMRSAVRSVRHPFKKVLSAKPGDIYREWMSGSGLTQSCPDFALRDPFPHHILFEGKYFSSRGSTEFAQRELVKNIYEAFFYRGLPSLSESKKHPAWNYDYACLLAYDASTAGTLSSAWKELPPATRRSFWEGANVYVMVLRPERKERLDVCPQGSLVSPTD